jgi:hypothetical protein
VHFWHLRKFFALKVIQDFGSGNVMDAVGIERGEARGATMKLQYPSATVPWVLFMRERRRPGG